MECLKNLGFVAKFWGRRGFKGQLCYMATFLKLEYVKKASKTIYKGPSLEGEGSIYFKNYLNLQ